MAFDLLKYAKIASNFLVAAAPYAEEGATLVGHPEIAAGISTAEKIFHMAQAGLPAAKVLLAQATGGTPLTATQLTDFEAKYGGTGGDYERTKADLAKAIAEAT